MISKLFTISSMYPGYLKSFYERFKAVKSLSYDEHYNLLLDDTTEFVGSYTKTFKKLGVDAKCIIANDYTLQNKWKSENCSRAEKDKNVLFEQVKKFQPEILWIDNLNYTDKEWLEHARYNIKSIKLIIGYHCSPFNPKIIDRLKFIDFLITCTPGLKQDMENRGIRSYLVYHGFDADILNRINDRNIFPQRNLIFSGSLAAGADFHSDRIDLIESIIRENIDVDLYLNLEGKYKIRAKQGIYYINEFLKKINLDRLKNYVPILQYGVKPVRNYSDNLLRKNLQSVFGIDMYNLYSRSKIVLNMHIGAAGTYAGNMRLFEVTGIGTCLLTDNKLNIGDLFDIDNEIVIYNSKKDCIQKVKWLLDNEKERNRIAIAGQKKTLKMHTVENRCRQVLEIIDGEMGKK